MPPSTVPGSSAAWSSCSLTGFHSPPRESGVLAWPLWSSPPSRGFKAMERGERDKHSFARFAAVVEEAGTAVLLPEVRALVHRRLQAWRGGELVDLRLPSPPFRPLL